MKRRQSSPIADIKCYGCNCLNKKNKTKILHQKFSATCTAAFVFNRLMGATKVLRRTLLLAGTGCKKPSCSVLEHSELKVPCGRTKGRLPVAYWAMTSVIKALPSGMTAVVAVGQDASARLLPASPVAGSARGAI